MSEININEQFHRLKPDVETLASLLFDASELHLGKRGAFLPHGACLLRQAPHKMVVAGPPNGADRTNSVAVLPELYKALRTEAQNVDVRAVGVAEHVFADLDGTGQRPAMKVLVEHREGLCVALYITFRRSWLGSITFDPMQIIAAKPEVSAWV